MPNGTGHLRGVTAPIRKTVVIRMGRLELEAVMGKAKRAAIYLRVSTDQQTTENQRRVLTEVARP